MMLSSRLELICKLSLSFMWLFTAATSVWWGRSEGYAVLSSSHIEGQLADILINAGSFLDFAIGIWLLTRFQLKRCYQFQILVIVSYTLLLSVIDVHFWLHPFGPITKNIPIVALLIVLLDSHYQSKADKNNPSP